MIAADQDITPQDVQNIAPVGAVSLYAGASDPNDDWMISEGRSLLRADYADLFAVIGTQYGAADADHFNIPDFRGRFPVGIKSTDPEYDTLGETGGEKTHTLSEAELATHHHSYPYTAGLGAPGAGNAVAYTGGQGSTQNSSDAGDGDPHNNLPPYFGINFIIRVRYGAPV